ncbi:uncharacterized protein J4E92_005783 [Alternaria infectoria]|uniref:uncharacterized protein n=1 Tax=Alternaria infectoria TaxID=45303 RepID=UPI0022208B78|nr:uncharacterized protein J4E92_005783 [Alternaria infectoria]KAI4928299.1 hypothetical protein J4E92_005783 [Alternaria infectoria]
MSLWRSQLQYYLSYIRSSLTRACVPLHDLLKTFSCWERFDLLFCPTCSSPVFCAFKDPARNLGVVTGALGNVDIGGRQLIKFGGQGFVADTEDGGASPWLCALNGEGEDLKRYESVVAGRGPGAKELPADWPQFSTLPELKAKEEESVPIRCKCGGVDLVLQRGDYKHMAEDELPSNVEPVSRKLKAGFCGCDSCRLQSGVDIFNWTYAETKYITFGKDSSKDFPKDMYALNELIDAKDPAVGTLKYYNSSPDVYRHFCGTCSAVVFYTTGKRPQIFDIAIGLLESKDGARVENMLYWPFGITFSFQEDGDSGWRESAYERLRSKAEEWRIARGCPKNWKSSAEYQDIK